jgi:hypothetical protein
MTWASRPDVREVWKCDAVSCVPISLGLETLKTKLTSGVADEKRAAAVSFLSFGRDAYACPFSARSWRSSPPPTRRFAAPTILSIIPPGPASRIASAVCTSRPKLSSVGVRRRVVLYA